MLLFCHCFVVTVLSLFSFVHAWPCLRLVVVQVADIDFFAASPFPAADVITMGMILHDWGPAKKQLLMRKVR